MQRAYSTSCNVVVVVETTSASMMMIEAVQHIRCCKRTDFIDSLRCSVFMYAIHRQAAPPSGVAFSLSARLTPSCLQSTSSSKSKIVRNLVTATNDFLQLFEVVEEVVSNGAPALHTLENGVANGEIETERETAEPSEEKKPAEANGETQVSPCRRSVAWLVFLFTSNAINSKTTFALMLLPAFHAWSLSYL